MSRKQIKFTYQIGYDVFEHSGVQMGQFEQGLAAAASRLCGGCTTSQKDGWWCEDGDERKERFESKAQRERCFQLELTCEPSKADDVHNEMIIATTRLATRYQIKTDWVHVTETEMTGRHFSVNAMAEAMRSPVFIGA